MSNGFDDTLEGDEQIRPSRPLACLVGDTSFPAKSST